MNNGIDDLKNLQRRAEELNGTQEVPIGELLTDKFMRQNTAFETIDAFFEASAWDFDSMEDFEAIPEEALDSYVAKQSGFPNWHAMMEKAGTEYVARRLGL